MHYKCLHIITRLANGGAEETLFDLVLQLAKNGIYCDIAVGREQAPDVLEKFDLPDKCTIHTIPHLVRNPKPLYEILGVREIRLLIRKHTYNIVQTHGSKAGILGRIAAHKEKVPLIIGMIHGIAFPPALGLPARLLYKNIERYAATISDALVCVGEDMKKKYIEAKVGKEEQYSVIYTGMRLEQFFAIASHSDFDSQASSLADTKRKKILETFHIPHDDKTIILGSIGRLEDRKNQTALISMLPKLLEYHPVHLCLIGDGPNFSILQAYAVQLGVANHITFTGYVSDVTEILPLIDIHCMVSLWEGLPRVLVQTSAAGIPNVCYEVDGAWEIVKHNVSGFIVEHGDEETYIQRLLELMENPTQRQSFGKEASLLADTRWSLDTFGKETIALYQQYLGKSE